MPPEIIVEKGLKLRLLMPDDAEAMLIIFRKDPNIPKTVTWPAGLADEQAVRQKIIQMRVGSTRYAIVGRNDNIIGYIGVWEDGGYFGNEPRKGEFGFGYFLDPDSRGKGIIARSLVGMLDEALRVYSVKTFAAYIADDNLASQSVVKSLGFIRTDEVYEEPVLHCLERKYEKNIP